MRAHRSIAAAAALVLALSGTAQAGPWTDPPARAPARLAAAATPAAAPALPATPAAAVTHAAPATPAAAPAPRAGTAPAAPERAKVTETAPAPTSAPAPTLAQRPAPVRAEAPRKAERPPVRTVRYAGGGGSVWKAGRDGHAFSGTFGGCRITGSAGPGGFRLLRAC